MANARNGKFVVLDQPATAFSVNSLVASIVFTNTTGASLDMTLSNNTNLALEVVVPSDNCLVVDNVNAWMDSVTYTGTGGVVNLILK